MTEFEKTMKNTVIVKEILKECKKAGYKLVSIDKKYDEIESSKRYIFSPIGSIFAEPKRKSNGWPAIWDIVEKLGICTGAGNGEQHQHNIKDIEPQVWELINNKWRRIE